MDQIILSSSSCSPVEQPWLSSPSLDNKIVDNKDQQMCSGGHSAATTPTDAADNEKSSGSVEIDAAVTFLTDIIKSSAFSKQSTENFRRALTDLLKQHYDGHWYPNDPFKGSGYRCLRVNGVMNPLLTKAAQLSGLPLSKFRHAFPVELTVWVDPGDVSVRFGEEGSIGVYYAKSGSGGLQHDHQQMDDLRRLARQAPRRACTPPPDRRRSSTATLWSTTATTTCGSATSKPHRFSPPLPSMVAESPPSSQFIFSPYDGKSMRINAHNLASYSSSNASPDFYQSPSRKYQALVSSSGGVSLDRRTPPPSNNSGFIGQSSFHQRQQQPPINQSPPRNYFGQSNNGLFYGDSSKQHGAASFLESIDFDSTRHTPPSFAAQSQRAAFDFDSSPPSWQQQQQQQQPMGGEYQFYSNAHLGSAYSNGQTAALGHQRRFGASGRLLDPMGVVN